VIEQVRKALAEADAEYRATLATVLRSYVDDAHVERAVELVRRLVLSIPTSLELLVDLAHLPGANPGLAALARDALDYVQDPEDLLPESRYGLYGYLDDAYLVHRLVALAYGSLGSGERAAVTVEQAKFQKLEKLVALGGKLLPEPVRRSLDERLARAKEHLRSGGGAPPLADASARAASGILDRFAEHLAGKLASPPSVHAPRFGAIAGDAGAWSVTAEEARFLETGARPGS
jgi:uncharacterized membrane protein YkvA (DUF1232 family)